MLSHQGRAQGEGTSDRGGGKEGPQENREGDGAYKDDEMIGKDSQFGCLMVRS